MDDVLRAHLINIWGNGNTRILYYDIHWNMFNASMEYNPSTSTSFLLKYYYDIKPNVHVIHTSIYIDVLKVLSEETQALKRWMSVFLNV